VLSGVLAVLTVLTLIAGPSLLAALTRPGTDSVAARLAEWARNHGLGSIITLAERLQYDLHPPKVGGTPKQGLPTPATVAVPTRSHVIDKRRALPLPPPVQPLASPALPGEGTWHVAATVDGLPAVAVAFLRPDSVHTAYVSGLVWMNPKLLTFALHPGVQDPGGGNWGQPDTIPPGQRRGLLGAFNSGFRLNSSRGGYYAYGHTARALRTGAASFVIDTNGSATVGVWGRDVGMSSRVAAVRQNLALVVDGGQPVAGLDSNVEQRWGLTLGNRYYVSRSAVGVTSDGALIYAAGDALSVSSLARLMARAGSQRAMELDINPAWTSFVLYDGKQDPTDPVPHSLLPSMHQPARRYYGPVSRDFFSVFAKP
jgi:hypothetical protein